MWLCEQALPTLIPADNGRLSVAALFVFHRGGATAPCLDLIADTAKQGCVVTGGRRSLQTVTAVLTATAFLLANRHQSCAKHGTDPVCSPPMNVADNVPDAPPGASRQQWQGRRMDGWMDGWFDRTGGRT